MPAKTNPRTKRRAAATARQTKPAPKSTRTVTYGAACSLDLFIARPDQGVDWLRYSKDVSSIMADYWKTIDAVVMGRKTYDVARGSGGSGGSYGNVRSYVFSRTLPPGKQGGVEIVGEDAAGFLRRLKAQPGKGICVMGGGELARSLFEADLIDEVGLNIHPVLLGSGIPLFHTIPRQIDLELFECRQIQHGCVYVIYRVKR
jgi:dihydrofolate reductase